MEIEKLPEQPESRTLEFKRDLSSLSPILKTIVAFTKSASDEILKVVKSGAMIPCFDNNHPKDGIYWIDSLKPSKSFIGKQKYFYTIYEHETKWN